MAKLTFPEPKDPQADLIYAVSYAGWFGADPVDPDQTTIAAIGCTLHTASIGATQATFWLSGGTHDTDAAITITARSVGGQVDQRTLFLKIRER